MKFECCNSSKTCKFFVIIFAFSTTSPAACRACLLFKTFKTWWWRSAALIFIVDCCVLTIVGLPWFEVIFLDYQNWALAPDHSILLSQLQLFVMFAFSRLLTGKKPRAQGRNRHGLSTDFPLFGTVHERTTQGEGCRDPEKDILSLRESAAELKTGKTALG